MSLITMEYVPRGWLWVAPIEPTSGYVTASRGVAVLQRDIGIDFNQTGGINEIKYRRRQQVIE